MDKHLYKDDFFFVKTNEYELVEFISEKEVRHTKGGRNYHPCFRTSCTKDENKTVYDIVPGHMRFPLKESFYEDEVRLKNVYVKKVRFTELMDGWSVKANRLELTVSIYNKGQVYPEINLCVETEWFIDMRMLAKVINLINRYLQYGGAFENLNFDIATNYKTNTFLHSSKSEYSLKYLIESINNLKISYKSHFQSRPGKDDVTHYTVHVENIPENDFYFQNLLHSYFSSKYHDKVNFNDGKISIRSGHSYSYGGSLDDRVTQEKEMEVVKNQKEILIACFAIAYNHKDHLIHYLAKCRPEKQINF